MRGSNGGSSSCSRWVTLGFMELIVYGIGAVISLLLLHAIIRHAVSDALETHYKNVRWYEKTGEWAGKNPPRPFSAGSIKSK